MVKKRAIEVDVTEPGPFGDTLMTPVAAVIHRDPDILVGVPVFVGTGVPLRAMIDDLGGGQALGVFL